MMLHEVNGRTLVGAWKPGSHGKLKLRMLPSIHMAYSELFNRFLFLKTSFPRKYKQKAYSWGKKKKKKKDTFISIIQFTIKPFKSERTKRAGFMKSFCTYPLFAYPVVLLLSP